MLLGMVALTCHPRLIRLRQKDCEIEDSVGYTSLLQGRNPKYTHKIPNFKIFISNLTPMNKLEDGEQALNKGIAPERILDLELNVCC